MKEPEILNDVLWLAIEDVSGLWEILWDLKSHYPTMPDHERQAVALRTVREASVSESEPPTPAVAPLRVTRDES